MMDENDESPEMMIDQDFEFCLEIGKKVPEVFLEERKSGFVNAWYFSRLWCWCIDVDFLQNESWSANH